MAIQDLEGGDGQGPVEGALGSNVQSECPGTGDAFMPDTCASAAAAGSSLSSAPSRRATVTLACSDAATIISTSIIAEHFPGVIVIYLAT
jgi:hypothetical protein